MIDLETIEREINELEARGDTTYSLCERLSWLYIVRDHLLPEKKPELRSVNPMGGSEFLEAASGVSCEDVLKILDTHMSALQIVQPKEYNSIMRKIRALKES